MKISLHRFKEIIKEEVCSIIVEAKFDAETTEISRAVVTQFKEGFKEFGEGGFEVEIDVPSKLETFLNNIQLNVEFASYSQAPRIEGEYSDGSLKIFLEIPTSGDVSPIKTISSWRGELKGTIRHELEHSLQDSAGELEGYEEVNFENADDFLDYYYDPIELDAFAVEIYKRAKTEKKPVNSFIDDRVNKFAEEAEDFLYLGEMSESDFKRHVQNLRDELTKLIKKHFPKAQFRNT